MADKANWILNGFITKDLYAPYRIEKDVEYYGALQEKYKILLKNAEFAGADKYSLSIIASYSKKVLEAIRDYNNGKISTSHIKIKNLVRGCQNDRLAVSTISDSFAFPGDHAQELQLFRARTSNQVQTFSKKEMLHLPYEMRGKTGNYRFSIPGIPSLYLGNSSYACWIELGKPSEAQFNVSPVLVKGELRVFNLAVMTRELFHLNEFEEAKVHCWLKLIVLMIATSFRVAEEGRIFKSEYIVSQGIMLACKEIGLDGIAYYSKRVSDEAFAHAAVNLALFAPYKYGKSYSEVCSKLKIDDSYNYSIFKQLRENIRNRDYEHYRVLRSGITIAVGEYTRQYQYSDTEFCSFDKFLFSSWYEKESIPWGNAL